MFQFRSFTFLVSKRKRLIRGAIPSLNLPVKSVPVLPAQPRRELVRQVDVPVPAVYRNLEQFKKKLFPLVMKGWSKTEGEDSVVFDLFHTPYTLPRLSLSVSTSLNFSVAVFNWFLPDDHFIYKNHRRSVKYTSISSLISTLEGAQICEGLSMDDHVNAICEGPTPACGSSSVMGHTTPLKDSTMKKMVHHFRLKFSSGLNSPSCFAMTFRVQAASNKRGLLER